MRFKADGPAIPDFHLDERDAGNVVFLCGAGVSIPAGMPSFLGLAQHVTDEVDPPLDSEIRRALQTHETDSSVVEWYRPSLDRVFQMLYQQYGREQVVKIVWNQLNEPPQSQRHHRIVARLSADAKGDPQIVTTNFDRLFEVAPASRRSGDTGRRCTPTCDTFHRRGLPTCMVGWPTRNPTPTPTSSVVRILDVRTSRRGGPPSLSETSSNTTRWCSSAIRRTTLRSVTCSRATTASASGPRTACSLSTVETLRTLTPRSEAHAAGGPQCHGKPPRRGPQAPSGRVDRPTESGAMPVRSHDEH